MGKRSLFEKVPHEVAAAMEKQLTDLWEQICAEYEAGGEGVPAELPLLMEDVCQALGMPAVVARSVLGTLNLPGDEVGGMPMPVEDARAVKRVAVGIAHGK